VEWLDLINQSCANPFVRNAARGEFFERAVAGAYGLVIDLAVDAVFLRIEQMQLLAESDYWVVQKYSDDSFEKG
jgi:hypothetical protein